MAIKAIKFTILKKYELFDGSYIFLVNLIG